MTPLETGTQTTKTQGSSQATGRLKKGAVWATWHTDAQSRLVIKQAGSVVLRLLIGLPLLAAGLFMLWNFITAPVYWFIADGWQGLATGAPGMLVTGLLTLCFAPLGWYVTFARPSVIVDGPRHEVQDVYDWRIGRKVHRHDSRLFTSVRVSREVLNDESNRKGPLSYGNVVRLMARPSDKLPSLQVALFEEDEEARPAELGTLVAQILAIPVEIDFERIRSAREEDEDREEEDEDTL